jgi:hypothetical protein
MPNYKDGSVFNHLPTDTNFDTLHTPGQIAPFSGIYKCANCGFEAVSTRGNRLPPEAFCSYHSPQTWPNVSGNVRWRLVAAAIHVRVNA